jgi:hypothetical protein
MILHISIQATDPKATEGDLLSTSVTGRVDSWSAAAAGVGAGKLLHTVNLFPRRKVDQLTPALPLGPMTLSSSPFRLWSVTFPRNLPSRDVAYQRHNWEL